VHLAYQLFSAELDEWSLLYSYKVLFLGVIVGAMAAYVRLSKKSPRDRAAAFEKAIV